MLTLVLMLIFRLIKQIEWAISIFPYCASALHNLKYLNHEF